METNKVNNQNKIGGINHRIGFRIKAKQVRLIDPDSKNLGVVSIQEALAKAEEFGLELVELNKGETPLCKIMDYGKMKYQKSKQTKSKEQKTHEIQFRPKIAVNDFETKLKSARKLLEKGSNIHLTVEFKGREFSHQEIGKELLLKAQKALEDISSISRDINIGNKRMDMMLSSKTKQM